MMEKKNKLRFSERETHVLELICKDKTTKQIAKALKITPNRVEFHKKRIYTKTMNSNAIGAVKYAVKKIVIGKNQ